MNVENLLTDLLAKFPGAAKKIDPWRNTYHQALGPHAGPKLQAAWDVCCLAWSGSGYPSAALIAKHLAKASPPRAQSRNGSGNKESFEEHFARHWRWAQTPDGMTRVWIGAGDPPAVPCVTLEQWPEYAGFLMATNRNPGRSREWPMWRDDRAEWEGRYGPNAKPQERDPRDNELPLDRALNRMPGPPRGRAAASEQPAPQRAVEARILVATWRPAPDQLGALAIAPEFFEPSLTAARSQFPDGWAYPSQMLAELRRQSAPVLI